MFTSKEGPETAESWYSDMERFLDSLRFSSEEMVNLATFTLKDFAYN